MYIFSNKRGKKHIYKPKIFFHTIHKTNQKNRYRKEKKRFFFFHSKRGKKHTKTHKNTQKTHTQINTPKKTLIQNLGTTKKHNQGHQKRKKHHTNN